MTSYQISAQQQSRKANGGLFYSATLYYINVGPNDSFILSSQEKGGGELSVDDVLNVIITDMANSTNRVSFMHNFGSEGGIRPIPPVNLNQVDPRFDMFRGKQVKVTIELSDKYGGVESASPIYLTLQP